MPKYIFEAHETYRFTIDNEGSFTAVSSANLEVKPNSGNDDQVWVATVDDEGKTGLYSLLYHHDGENKSYIGKNNVGVLNNLEQSVGDNQSVAFVGDEDKGYDFLITHLSLPVNLVKEEKKKYLRVDDKSHLKVRIHHIVQRTK